MRFKFYVENQHIEAEDIEKALAMFATYLYFPGIIFAQEIDEISRPIGNPINLRTKTPEGILFDKTRAKNKQNATYGHLALLELVRLCEGYGIKKFQFLEGGDCIIELNEKGQSLQKKSIEENEKKKKISMQDA